MESNPHRNPARTPLRTAAALLLAGVVLACGCSSRPPAPPSSPRPFAFEHDTFAFANQTYWVYQQDPATGRMSHLDRNPPPDFAHRCFVLVRAAREFKLHARFDPDVPPASEHEYRDAVRRIVRRSSRHPSAPADRVVIPGFPDLRSFSAAHEQRIKEEVGGAWQSYVQRGHWRMVLPFPDSHRERTARNLVVAAAAGSPTAVHVVDFPGLAINHALLVYGVESSPQHHRFLAYDPNAPDAPIRLDYDRRTHRFSLPPTPYFVGGTVEAYTIYHSFWY